MESIPTFTHRINERLDLLKQSSADVLRVRIRRVDSGYYFFPQSNTFVDSASVDPVYDLDDFWYEFSDDFYGEEELRKLSLTVLPASIQDLLFEYQTFDYDGMTEDMDESTLETYYERHVFGGAPTLYELTTCTVMGTLKDVSGKPIAGERVEAYLNRAGYFTHKAGLIGYAATALTDETGYFELPLVVGLDVTINVPVIGFSTRGIVPNVSSVNLTSQSLLSMGG